MSLLKTLLNVTSPIFHNNKYIVDSKENSEIFNSFFSKQCSLIPSKSLLPSQLTLLTEHTLANCYFSKKDILQIIRNPDSNKAHGYIWSAFVCWNFLVTRFWELVYEMVNFHWNGKNVVPIHNKVDKKTIRNYRLVSPLPICRKIFECLHYDTTFNFNLRIIYFLQTNLDSDQEILASIKVFKLIMKS